MLTENQKQKIDANIMQLDYLEGTGLISNNRKHLAKEMFVFIGTGGTGCKALARLKRTMTNQVDSYEMENQVMFLAIDTAMKELDERVENNQFSPEEILKIPYAGAHESINPDKILPQLKSWVHKELWAETGGEATTAKEFNGTGAGGKRQCGRVLFSQAGTQGLLFKKLARIQNVLADMGGSERIQVFFLSGTAGGTGSGTILDLAFLTRHFLKTILGPAYKKVTFSAYLFLPSATGDSTAIMSDAALNGNCNGYAAIKEIDHYMTLTERQEHYTMNYGTVNASNVDIAENVFDFCTLVEGVGDGGNFTGDVEASQQIVADSIFNIICAGNTKQGKDGKNQFLVDSFLSNAPAQTNARITQHSDKVWPRDTNYIYSVIGYSSCIVPIDLLTSYVAKKIFDEVFQLFRRADDATEERAKDFLNSCGLEISQLSRNYRTLSKQQMIKEIQNRADEEFKISGPFYMINLMKEAVDLIENAPADYHHKAMAKQSGVFRTDMWRIIQKRYEEASDYLRKINQTLYEVYSYAITSLRDVLEANAKLITETNEYKGQFKKTFCWSPIDLTPGEHATVAVTEYLDDMLDRKAVKQKARLFMENMCEKKEEWTGIERDSQHGAITFNVAKNIREFINTNLQKCVNTTLEEFLVKAYSGKKDAPVSAFDVKTGREICSEETKDAANQILKRLSNNASALAPTNHFRLEETYSNIYLTLPSNCPWLNEAIGKLAETYGIDKNNIYESSAKDSVAFCRLYTGVPAWALYWTAGAEENYEGADGQGPFRTGIHMDQGEHGTNWAELPNLYPEKLWTPAQRALRQREAGISARVRESMERARTLGLLVKEANGTPYYHLHMFREDMGFEAITSLLNLKKDRKYTLEEVIQKLTDLDAIIDFKVEFVNMVMSTTDKLEGDELERFYFDLSCRTIRRRWTQYKQLEETLRLIDNLNEFLSEHNAIVIEGSVLSTFIDCLKWELLIYDGRRNVWKGVLKDECVIGSRLENKFDQICAHFYGFYAFASLEEGARKGYEDRIQKIVESADDSQFEQAEEQCEKLKKSLYALREARDEEVKPWPEDSPFKAANSNPWPMATLAFAEKAGSEETAAAIRDFYTELINNL